MLYQEIAYEDRRKKIKLMNEIKNIIHSHGLCPLCLSKLLDANDGYTGINYKLIVNQLYYHITICSNCNNKIKKKDAEEIKKYLDSIEFEIRGIFEREL